MSCLTCSVCQYRFGSLVCLWEEADDELVLWLLALDVPGHLFTTDELRDEGDDG